MTDETGTTRTERLLALLVLQNMADASQVDKSVLLKGIGFGNPEIAQLLGTTTPTVTQNLYEARKSKGKKRAKRATKQSAKKVSKKSASKRGQQMPKR